MTPRFVGHIDADCFYVSAERVRDEFLRDQPVGVIGNQGACVIAKSYEMKHAGVKTGEPIWEAMRKCPDGIYVKRDFRWYEVLSHLIQGVVREFSPKVEFYSIDEFFFEAIAPKGMDFQGYAQAIRDAVMDRVHVPVSVGIARSRTLAKLISDSTKPFGAKAVLDREQEVTLMADLPVTEVSGIAGRRERSLLAWNIRTCLEFAEADRRLVRRLLTATGEALWYELNGESVTPLVTNRPRHKFLARGGSLGQATSDPNIVYAWLVRNVERLIEELDYHEFNAGRLGVQLWYKNGDFRESWGSLEAPSSRFDVLLEVARVCLRKNWLRWGTATRMEVVAGKLADRSSCQLGLFDGSDRDGRVAEVKRLINERQGRFALRSGQTLPLVDHYRDATHGYDICDVRGKICF